MQTTVKTAEVTQVTGTVLRYVIIENEKGKVIISIGEKNYIAINNMLNNEEKKKGDETDEEFKKSIKDAQEISKFAKKL